MKKTYSLGATLKELDMKLMVNQPVSRGLNVGKTERKASLAGGLVLLLQLLKSRPKMAIGLPLGLGAGYLLYRGVTGRCTLYLMMEINRAEGGNKGIQVQRSITINKPRDELFRIWRNFENLPRFMKHLRSVRLDRSNGQKRWHWIATAPLGSEVEWDSEVTEERENEHLAWKSLPGSPVESMGDVHFNDAPDGRGTVLTVTMQYHPPAGSMGAAVAKFFGEEPSQQIHEDLYHFKQIMETGETASIEGQTSGRNKNFGRSMAQRLRERDLVDLASEHSFPASDPPVWTAGKRA
jgi:uncharacterized membrane protein